MFSRLLDVMETTGERRAERTKKPFKGRFSGPNDKRRWKNLKQKDAAEMLRVVRDEVFPHCRKLNGGTTFSARRKGASGARSKLTTLKAVSRARNDMRPACRW